jgi:hypothetical protein
VTAIAGGAYHSLALKNDGTVWAWGYNGSGQLGDGMSGLGNYRSSPFQVLNLTGVTAVTGGAYHSLAVKNDGTAWTWGNNSHGQLGDGTTTDRAAPGQVPGLTGITTVAAGDRHSLFMNGNCDPVMPPTAVQADPATLYIGGSCRLSASPGSGGDTVQWFTDSCGQRIPIPGGATPIVNLTSTTIFYARTKGASTGCVSASCATMTVVVEPRVAGDLDGDRDVDQEDFGHFQRCLSGSGVWQTDPACADARLDSDEDVDLDDFTIFQRCMSGSDVLADGDCAD